MTLAIAVLCGLALSPAGAQGALVTIQIEAVVDGVWDSGNYLEGKVQVGDIITGTYAYDLSTPDSEPLEYAGIYEHHSTPAGMALSAGGFEFTTDPDNVAFVVEILNNIPPSGKDHVLMRSYTNLPLSNGVAIDLISWQLDDASGTAIHSTELPTSPLALGDWQSVFGLEISLGKSLLRGHVTSAVPEPGAIFLFCLGGLLLRRRAR